jgi:peptide-methionine (S)-S-oxide reductase
MKNYILSLSVIALAACSSAGNAKTPQNTSEPSPKSAASNMDTAIFAGGCFWCVEADFEKLPGVIEAVSGYTGGHVANPTYKVVTRTETGHYEAVKVIFDPAQVSYSALVEYFWRTVDPTDPNGQFCDKGSSYRTAIFARPDQIDTARTSKTNLEAGKPFAADIVTPILPTAMFYDAEEYHQDYYKKNKVRYKYYRNGCRRDKRIKQLWGN